MDHSYESMFYTARRAKRGQGKRKAELIRRLREANDMITHFIIGDVARNNPEKSAKRVAEEAVREAVVVELLEITK